MDKTILVFATHNAHKAQEIQQLVGSSYLIKTLTDIGCSDDIAETGSTLAENAQIKSRFVYEKFGLDCFADDTGLEVDILGGSPGVYSARYAGPQRSDADNINLLLQNLEGKTNRTAQFRTVISLIQGGKETVFEGILRGAINTTPQGDNGFGYDPVFEPEGSKLTLAQISMEEKNNISHRARAMQQLITFLK
jgi:XTP/dITP diphosphohydrolase